MATGFGSLIGHDGQVVTFFQDSFGPPGEEGWDWGYRYGKWMAEISQQQWEQDELNTRLLHTAHDPNRIDPRNVRREFNEPTTINLGHKVNRIIDGRSRRFL